MLIMGLWRGNSENTNGKSNFGQTFFQKGVYIKEMKTTCDFNFELYQAG